ncbi:MAG: sigma-70 family RNA polymerase sigma factor [Phycisphaerae bacterium]|nr:RNA polymerase sigma factor [Phycisphaerae bacterium]NIP53419.1 RNA polymerase sigma factor [Phycisphaerae bacterium]NIS52669.1 RNA polymerase sigma factor [Phycisphaerae bacterium]NIU09911.1 RNA polymerase sigma factor [Phycisphaerae bacterium]NIU57649.1 sigma-70 family RNA polymerase sigma factor [Phycisphaerae bacterium]
MSEDRQLLKGLHRGESAALRQIYLKYKDDLLTIARSLVHDINTAEDCLQDVFVSLASDGYRIRSNLKGYLLSSVVNRARDYLRRETAQSNFQVNMQTKRIDATETTNIPALDENMKTIIRALEKLSLEQREVIVLHLQGDMKFREIATMLDMSINTVQSRYRYGIEKLRQVLTKKEAI